MKRWAIMSWLVASWIMAISPVAAAPAAIIHVNGIQTTLETATASMLLLKDRVQQRANASNYIYGIAYNATAGFMADLLELYRQKTHEETDARSFWRLIDHDLLPGKWMTEAEFGDYLARFIQENIYPDMGEHLAIYHQYLAESRKIVFVAHSQGNMYANAEVNMLISGPDDAGGKVSVVGIASPARYVLPGSHYVTSSWDNVINVLRSLYPVLPANINLGFQPFHDWSGHSFVKSYMDTSLPAHERIVDAVIRQAS